MFKWLEQYFTFTKGERNAIIALVALSVIILIAPRAYFYLKPAEHINNSQYLKQADAFAKQYKDSSHAYTATPKNTEAIDSGFNTSGQRISTAQYFNFDPNKIGIADWIKLGFTEKQALTIEHYKGKGAKFYVPEDLKRLYVLTPQHYEALLPFVKIDAAALPPKSYGRPTDY